MIAEERTRRDVRLQSNEVLVKFFGEVNEDVRSVPLEIRWYDYLGGTWLSLITIRSRSLRYFDDAIGFAYCYVVYANAMGQRGELSRVSGHFFLEGKARERRDRFPMFLPITKNLRDAWELRICKGHSSFWCERMEFITVANAWS